MHIALFEPDPAGHRMVYVRYIVAAMARHGGLRATLITSARGRSAPAVQAMEADRALPVSVMTIEAPILRQPIPRKLQRQFGYTAALGRAVRSLAARDPVDHVFIPFLDDFALLPFAVQPTPFGKTRWSGIAIRPRFHLAAAGGSVPHRAADRIEGWAYRRLLGSPVLDTMFSIDPYLAPQLGDPRVVTVVDPADITALPADPTWLSVSDSAVVLLVYGYIDGRKAIDRLLRIANDPRMPRALTVALVGTQDASMASILEGSDAQQLRTEGRLVEVARHITDGEEASAFARADIVWAYYPGSYCSSGAMVRAGQMSRALMATEEGLVGWLTRQHGSGLTAPEDDDEGLLQALVRLTADAALRRTLGAAGHAYFTGHDSVAFGDHIVERLERGVPA
ncbi:hypothetical protein [Sphingomonas sp. 1185]|uniref:hypothetical protein n=1 Tax=Sphingomonas sp. 1185 TaxID=3156411 RepID=UPI0033976DB0